jgi:chaperonin GroEL
MSWMAAPPPPLSGTGKPPTLPFSLKKPPPMPVYKDLHFNRDLSATKKLQAGVDLVARLVGVTLGPKGRNVVLSNKYGPPKIVNDGETVLKEIELEDPLENLGVKLVRQAGARTNDVAGDGCTTSIILAQGLIAEGMKVLAAGINPVQIARGIEKTASALVSELRLMSREVCFVLVSLSSGVSVF